MEEELKLVGDLELEGCFQNETLVILNSTKYLSVIEIYESNKISSKIILFSTLDKNYEKQEILIQD